MPQLDDQILVITGGTQGVGEAIALHAASCGAAGIVLCGRQNEKGAAVVDTLEQSGCPALFVKADLSSEMDCRNVVQTCDDRFGRVDGLVNAAADTRRGSLLDTTVQFWDHLFAVNVRAPFILSQECVRIMKREKTAGSIVNIISVAAYCGLHNLTAYSSTKGALSTLTKNLAHGLSPDRIRVNGIMLGWTDTPNEHVVQQGDGQPENWLELAEANSDYGRLIKPIDVARLSVYLLSSDSGIVTGSLIDYAQRVMGTFGTQTYAQPSENDAGNEP